MFFKSSIKEKCFLGMKLSSVLTVGENEHRNFAWIVCFWYCIVVSKPNEEGINRNNPAYEMSDFQLG
jgi:hypothetical protein